MNPVIPPELSVPLVQWIPLLPVWLVLLGGMIVALLFWPVSPWSSLLTVLALLLLGGSFAVGPFVNAQLAQAAARAGMEHRAVRLTVVMVANTILNLGRAVGFILLLTAVFIGRRSGQLPPPLPVYPPSSVDPRIL